MFESRSAADERWWAILYPLAWMGVLFLFSSIPGTATDDSSTWAFFESLPSEFQSFLHVPAYALLGFLWSKVLRTWSETPLLFAPIAFLITLGYGAFDEWHQTFVAGRFATVTDMALNSAGALLGVVLYWFITRQSLGSQ